jgi:hypothetical protein
VIEASRWAEDVRLEVLQIPVANSVAEAGDGLIAGVKDRGSDADVLHDATSLNNWNNPIGRPATPPPPPAPVMAGGPSPPLGPFFAPRLRSGSMNN